MVAQCLEVLPWINSTETTSTKELLIWGCDLALLTLLLYTTLSSMWKWHIRNEHSWRWGNNVVFPMTYQWYFPMDDHQCFLIKDLNPKRETWKKNSKMELMLSREHCEIQLGGLWEAELTPFHVKLNFWTVLNQRATSSYSFWNWFCITKLSIK